VDQLIDNLTTRLMGDVRVQSITQKIPIVFLTEEDIRQLVLMEKHNLENDTHAIITRIDRSRPFTRENIRLEIIKF
jgi:hypothetical protein